MTSERPWPKRHNGPRARVAKADAQATALAPIVVEIRASGAIRLHAIAEELNARGIPTARGAKWGTSSVFRLRARIHKLSYAAKSASS
jgi:hypothetical protein